MGHYRFCSDMTLIFKHISIDVCAGITNMAIPSLILLHVFFFSIALATYLTCCIIVMMVMFMLMHCHLPSVFGSLHKFD